VKSVSSEIYGPGRFDCFVVIVSFFPRCLGRENDDRSKEAFVGGKVWISDVIRSLCEAARSHDIRLRRDLDYELSLFSAQDLISASRRCLVINSATEFRAVLSARTVRKRNDVSTIHLKHGPKISSLDMCRLVREREISVLMPSDALYLG
jgi:hypothetical protein